MVFVLPIYFCLVENLNEELTETSFPLNIQMNAIKTQQRPRNAMHESKIERMNLVVDQKQ